MNEALAVGPSTPEVPAVSWITNLLRAGAIVGLDPREMTASALEQLAREHDEETNE